MSHSHNNSQRLAVIFMTSLFAMGFGANSILRAAPNAVTEFSVVACGIGIGLLAYSAYLFGRYSEAVATTSTNSDIEG